MRLCSVPRKYRSWIEVLRVSRTNERAMIVLRPAMSATVKMWCVGVGFGADDFRTGSEG